MDNGLEQGLGLTLAVVGGILIVAAVGGKSQRVMYMKEAESKPRHRNSLSPDEMRDMLISLFRSSSSDYMVGMAFTNCVTENAISGRDVDCDEWRQRFIAVIKGLKLSEKDPEEYVSNLVEQTVDWARRYSSNPNAVDARGNPLYQFVLDHIPLRVANSSLFIGPPGVGKSETTREVASILAQEYGLELVDYHGVQDYNRVSLKPWHYFLYIDLRLTSVEPADLTGIPRSLFDGKISEYVPFGWAEALSLAPGVLNLEELTNVQRMDLMSAAYQLVLDRRAGFTRFNNGVMIVGLGNPPNEWSSAATALPLPLLNRFNVFEIRPPTLDEWYNYMNTHYGERWFTTVYDFLRAYPNYLLGKPTIQSSMSQGSGLSPSDQIPTPRAWTKLAIQFYTAFRMDDEKSFEQFENAMATPNSCADLVSLIPHNDEQRMAKMACELARSAVGVSAGDLFILFTKAVIAPLRDIDKLFAPTQSKEEAMRRIEAAYDEFIKSFSTSGISSTENMNDIFIIKLVRELESYGKKNPSAIMNCPICSAAIIDYVTEHLPNPMRLYSRLLYVPALRFGIPFISDKSAENLGIADSERRAEVSAVSGALF